MCEVGVFGFWILRERIGGKLKGALDLFDDICVDGSRGKCERV
jgi:fructose 1,6-bisphosphatase